MSQTVIVTGGAGILGRAVVSRLRQKGWNPVPVDIAPEVEGGIGDVDLTDETSVGETFARVAAEHDGLAGLANIAGGFIWEKVEEGSLESFDRMYQMNLRTAAVACRAATGHLSAGGAIVNVGAAAVTAPGEGMASYAASKAGVAALTESLAEELRGRSIRVNAVLPTILDTPANREDMPEADRSAWVQPDDAAEVIAFLLSPEAHAVTGAGVKLSLGRPA